jgi:hypothetical protein
MGFSGGKGNKTITTNGNYAFKQAMAPYRRAGHLDALNGLGFHTSYDKWTHVQQLAYENGRMCAVNMRAAGLKPITWNAGVTRPNTYKTMLQRALDRVGNPFGQRQDNDPILNTDHLVPESIEGVY